MLLPSLRRYVHGSDARVLICHSALMMLTATPAPILSGGFPSFLITSAILTVAFKALYTYPLIP